MQHILPLAVPVAQAPGPGAGGPGGGYAIGYLVTLVIAAGLAVLMSFWLVARRDLSPVRKWIIVIAVFIALVLILMLGGLPGLISQMTE